MIESAHLFPVKKEGSEDVNNAIELWPRKKKSIKVQPDFYVRYYFIRIVCNTDPYNIKLVINNIEIEDLYLEKQIDGKHFYRSKEFKSKHFLQFNLGLYELALDINGERVYLSSLNNKSGLLRNKELSYMYEYVAASEWFSLYVYNYHRANSAAAEYDSSGQQHFWLSIAIAKNLLVEIDRFFNGDFDFWNRIKKDSIVARYSERSIIEEKDIEWLLEYKDFGLMHRLVDTLETGIDDVSQSVTVIDYDTYENRLILSCLYSIKDILTSLCDHFADSLLFPSSGIESIVGSVDNCIANINSVVDISPPFNSLPEFSNKIIDDVRYNELFELINRWYSTKNLNYGNQTRAPVLGVTQVFEHYCFTKIVECILDSGFERSNMDADSDICSSIALKRGGEIITIYYEPAVTKTSFPPLKTSSIHGYYTPDFAIIYNGYGGMRCGVIDAKFSIKETVAHKLSPDIYYKYGLFIHRHDNKPLDYVFAMYPDIEQSVSIDISRDKEHSESIVPVLGYFSVPFNDYNNNDLSGFLMNTIVGS